MPGPFVLPLLVCLMYSLQGEKKRIVIACSGLRVPKVSFRLKLSANDERNIEQRYIRFRTFTGKWLLDTKWNWIYEGFSFLKRIVTPSPETE